MSQQYPVNLMDAEAVELLRQQEESGKRLRFQDEMIRAAMEGGGREAAALQRADKRRQLERRLRPMVEQRMIQFASELVQDGQGGEAARGEVSNTPLANSLEATEPVGYVAGGDFAGGEDTLEVSLWVEWGRFDLLRSSLNAAKAQALAQSRGEDTDRGDVLVCFENDFAVMPTGTASDGKGPRYSWRLQRDGIWYYIADREELNAFPSIKVVIGSLPLMLRPIEEMWEIVKRDVENFGGKLVRNTISRVDPCVDLPDVPTSDFVAKKRADQLICRATNGTEFEVETHNSGRRQTGFRIGAKGASLSLNVYDKLYEVTKKQDEAKLEVLKKYRWGGAIPDHATRVEWRIRREKLVALGVDTVEDWFEKRAGIVRYLATQWIRFTEGDVDRKNAHQGRAETWSVWERLVKSADFFLQACPLKAATVTRRIVFDFQALARQTLGTISSSIVYAKGVIMDKGEFLAEAFDELERCLGMKDWGAFIKRQCRKRSLYEASNPASRIGEAPAHEATVHNRFDNFMRGGALCGTS